MLTTQKQNLAHEIIHAEELMERSEAPPRTEAFLSKQPIRKARHTNSCLNKAFESFPKTACKIFVAGETTICRYNTLRIYP
jgi:hypothetical protein